MLELPGAFDMTEAEQPTPPKNLLGDTVQQPTPTMIICSVYSCSKCTSKCTQKLRFNGCITTLENGYFKMQYFRIQRNPKDPQELTAQ
jgi:hypothetical protein